MKATTIIEIVAALGLISPANETAGSRSDNTTSASHWQRIHLSSPSVLHDRIMHFLQSVSAFRPVRQPDLYQGTARKGGMCEQPRQRQRGKFNQDVHNLPEPAGFTIL
jgi:hypothetical protein